MRSAHARENVSQGHWLVSPIPNHSTHRASLATRYSSTRGLIYPTPSATRQHRINMTPGHGRHKINSCGGGSSIPAGGQQASPPPALFITSMVTQLRANRKEKEEFVVPRDSMVAGSLRCETPTSWTATHQWRRSDSRGWFECKNESRPSRLTPANPAGLARRILRLLATHGIASPPFFRSSDPRDSNGPSPSPKRSRSRPMAESRQAPEDEPLISANER